MSVYTDTWSVAFRAKRRRWIARWRHGRDAWGQRHRRAFPPGCEWCMGHMVSAQVLLPRVDASGVPTIVLTFPGGDRASVPNIGSQRELYSVLRRAHDNAVLGAHARG